MLNVTCVQNFRSFGRDLIDFLIKSVFLEFLGFLGLNPMKNRCFDVVLSIPKVGTSLNEVMGYVGRFVEVPGASE